MQFATTKHVNRSNHHFWWKTPGVLSIFTALWLRYEVQASKNHNALGMLFFLLDIMSRDFIMGMKLEALVVLVARFNLCELTRSWCRKNRRKYLPEIENSLDKFSYFTWFIFFSHYFPNTSSNIWYHLPTHLWISLLQFEQEIFFSTTIYDNI